MQSFGMPNSYLGDHQESPDFMQTITGYRTWVWDKGEIYAMSSKQVWDTVMQAQCNRSMASHFKTVQYVKDHPEIRPDKDTGAIRLDQKAVEAAYEFEEHQAPDPNCSCGLYGFFDFEKAASYFPTLLGVCEFWGRAELHQDGLRAENAKIKAIASARSFRKKDAKRILTKYALYFGVFLSMAGLACWKALSLLLHMPFFGWESLVFALFGLLVSVNLTIGLGKKIFSLVDHELPLEEELKAWCKQKGVIYCSDFGELKQYMQTSPNF